MTALTPETKDTDPDCPGSQSCGIITITPNKDKEVKAERTSIVPQLIVSSPDPDEEDYEVDVISTHTQESAEEAEEFEEMFEPVQEQEKE